MPPEVSSHSDESEPELGWEGRARIQALTGPEPAPTWLCAQCWAQVPAQNPGSWPLPLGNREEQKDRVGATGTAHTPGGGGLASRAGFPLALGALLSLRPLVPVVS